MDFLILFLSTILTAFVSLSGGFLLLGKSKLAGFLNKIGKPFAAIVLLYCVFFDLIPEALEDDALPLWEVVVLALTGLLVCFVVNFLVGNFHKHGEDKELRSKSEAYSMLVIDSLHTLVDGVVIGVTFATSLGTGLLAAVSTAAHEIPQEIGDFGIMVRSKIEKKKIINLQIASALLLVPAAVLSFFIGGALLPTLPPLMALIAGFFLYIALQEIFGMIKEVKEKHHVHH
ncbi:ZIP family metal transporter [Candidatus Saccharibacteria bacterium]|nr:ZIP family metal transporter [Candidatus Saccharibacteria bacterium]MBQ7803007.1 ZIP family metal transporter [Candidatus Saccharibacteria bacterium]